MTAAGIRRVGMTDPHTGGLVSKLNDVNLKMSKNFFFLAMKEGWVVQDPMPASQQGEQIYSLEINREKHICFRATNYKSLVQSDLSKAR